MVKPKHWWHKQAMPSSAEHSRPSTKQPPSSTLPATPPFDYKRWLAGRCYRCLAKSHRVAQCRDPVRCWGCRRNGHTLRSCPHDATAGRSNTAGHQPPPSIHDRLSFSPLPTTTQAPTPLPDERGEPQPENIAMEEADYVPGLPEHRPVMTRALVFDTDEILAEAQDWMAHAVFVVAPEGAFPATTLEVTHALSQQLRLPPHNIKVSQHRPEDFLVKFDFAPQRDRAVAARFFNIAGSAYEVRSWRPDAHTMPHTFWYHIKLSIEGLPLHAWKDSALRQLLGPFAVYDRLTSRAYT